MLDITFEMETQGELHEDALMSQYELDALFVATRQSLQRDLERQLNGVVCAEHGQPPRLKITARYDNETEQFDLQYHIDTCCPLFLARVIKTLNRKD
jgi:hypothetical protein